MKNLNILFLFGLFSCGQQSEQDKNVLTEEKNSIQTIVQPDKQTTIQQPTFYFDTLVIKNGADSILSLIASKPIKTNLQIDTFKSVPQHDILLSYYEYAYSAQQTIKYRFRPSPSSGLSFTVYESHFIDEYTADSLFKLTKSSGQHPDKNKKVSRKHLAPAGLTYSYDYVIRFKDKIFTLNSPCAYSYKNYNSLRDSFKKSFGTAVPSDTIACKCGGFCK